MLQFFKEGFLPLMIGVGFCTGIGSLQGQTTQQTINFAGYTWNVRSGSGGPGPNYWSNSTENVWLDERGYLHMKIRRVNQTWYCSEVYTTHLTQYGEHRFVVESNLDSLDKSVVVGLFNYMNDTHEIDIEFAKWGVENNQKFGSYTVQPYTVSGNSESFAFALDTALSTHSFNWQPGYIAFTSFQRTNMSPSGMIKSWIYTGSDNPRDTDRLRTHINFWLFEGKAPADTNFLELIIRDIKLPDPLGTDVKGESMLQPETPELGQNFPNPFNQNTVIRYQVASNGPVHLDIFDTSGQQVSRLDLGEKNTGQHRYRFDARNLASGIYYYRLTTSHFQETKKMILMK